MTSAQEKQYNMANVIMGIGILLTVVPLGFMLITGAAPAGVTPKELIGVAYYYMVMALLPIGLGFFIGGLGWILVIKRHAKIEDESDEEDETDSE
ncbi:MAG: hypothetical protein AAFY98_08920 [Verrucomicrobiota bacterium]